MESLSPALEADFSSDGSITWWLYAPVQQDAPLQPPLNAREDNPVLGGPPRRSASEAGKWTLRVADARFNDFKPVLSARNGVLWASARLNSATGGARSLRVHTYCAVNVYLDGKLVLEKPQPAAGADDTSAEIEIPTGLSELTVAATLRLGFCRFQLSMTEGKSLGGLPRAVAGDEIVIPTATGKDPPLGPAVIDSITFAPKESFINPGHPAALLLLLRGSTARGAGPLSARFVTANGIPSGKEFSLAGVSERMALQMDYPVPANAGAVHEIQIEIRGGEKSLGIKTLRLLSPKGLAAAVDALAREIAERSTKAGRPFPNATLAVEKIKLFADGIQSGEEVPSPELAETLLELLAQARSFIPIEEAWKDPWEGKTGYFERAYVSRIDEAVQPYFVEVPSAYNREEAQAKKFPLVVFLHGYVPGYDKQRWWEPAEEFNVLFERHNAFLAIPFGRSNSDFQSCGEADVLDVIAEVERLYPIDYDRVYLYGYSMGGMAVYTLGAHYPDLFAAGIVIAGRADSPLQNFRPLSSFHPFKQWLIQADNPISLCENFLNIPLRIYHGRDDPMIRLAEAQRMETRLKELGCDAALTVVPGNHFSGFDVMTSEAPLQWLLDKRRDNVLQKWRMKTYSLQYARQDDVVVLAATGALRPLELEWVNRLGIHFTKDSSDVLQWRVGPNLFGPNQILNGPKLVGHKSPSVCGPVRQAICGSFLIVYGTSGSAEANARNKKSAEQFADDWHAFTRSRALIKADKDVDEDEKKNKNLFLYGEEQENLLHAAAAAKGLPFAVKDGSVTIGEKKATLKGKGFIYIYPNPFAGPGAERSVVICAGIPYGKEVGVNHKLDLVPDFLLYDDRIDDDSTSTNHALCAGFFDGQWRLNAETTWWFGAP